MRAILGLLLLALGLTVAPAQPANAAATTVCTTSGPADATWTSQVCLTAEAGPLSGDTTVSADVVVTGAGSSSVSVVEFHLDGDYLLTDYEAPYSFRLPTSWHQDGTHQLGARAYHGNGFATAPAQLATTFSNGNATAPPPNGATFTPRGHTPPAGEPLVVAATGDAAGGRAAAQSVSDRVAGWDPDIFLYLGDVYNRGTRAEFDNWYGRSDALFGRLRGVTNPTIGNHEYRDPGAAGYRDYWDNVPSFYSYDRGGWHFVSLDSTTELGQVTPGTAQFEWLRNDLAAAASTSCTLVYFHHPVRSIGDYADDTRLDELWTLLANEGVDLLLTGHDHNYQRWAALDASGQPAIDGTTQIVAGGGGHTLYPATRTDSRVVNVQTAAPDAYGALRLELRPTGGRAEYISSSGKLVDQTDVTCSAPRTADTTAPSRPTGVTAAAGTAGTVDLSWLPSTDDRHGVSYVVLRNGVQVRRVSGTSVTLAPPAGPHELHVEAVDVAGNRSGRSHPVPVTVPSTTLHTDGFESGDLRLWTSADNLPVTAVPGASGSWAARPVTTGAPTWARRTLAAGYDEVTVKARVKVTSRGTRSCWLKLMSQTGLVADLCTDPDGHLYSWNYLARKSAWSSTVVEAGGWHDVEMRLTTGPQGRVAIRYDGAELALTNSTGTYGDAGVSGVQLGMEESGLSFDLAVDDVVVTNGGPAASPRGLSVGDVTAPEGDAGSVVASVPVRLSAPSAQPVSVSYATGTGTAGPTDFRGVSGTLDFAPGVTSRTISVAVSPDSLDEVMESFPLTLSSPAGAVLIDSAASVKILDNDPAPQLRVSDVRLWEGNGGSTAAYFTVVLSAPATDNVTIDYATAGARATPGTDFTATTGSLTFTPGQISKSVAVRVHSDATDEPHESFGLRLSGLAGPARLADANGAATILDDDPTAARSTPNLRLGDLRLAEGNHGSASGRLTVRLSSPHTATVTAAFALTAGTAGSTDFTARTGTIRIPAGASSATIPVTVRGDALDEPTESFTATLSSPSGATLGDATGTVSIIDDDSAPRLAVSNVAVDEGQAGTGIAGFTVRLSAPATTTVTVTYATANGTATAGSDYTSRTGTLTFSPGQVSKSIAVTTHGDTGVESNEAFTLVLSDASGATIGDASGIATLRNDDP